MKAGIQRVHFLDFLRGVAILGMLVHHACFDLMEFYGFDMPIFETTAFTIVQAVFVLLFMMISGISTGFSRNPIRRGLIVLCGALAVSLVTYLVTPALPVRFGILHFMGAAMVIYGVSQKALRALPRIAMLPLLAAAFLVTYHFFPVYVTPGFLYPLGLISRSFSSADYYPLIPWLFAFLFGSYLSDWFVEGRAPRWMTTFRCPFVNFCGRNTLWIFLLHQPVFLGLFWLLSKVIPGMG